MCKISPGRSTIGTRTARSRRSPDFTPLMPVFTTGSRVIPCDTRRKKREKCWASRSESTLSPFGSKRATPEVVGATWSQCTTGEPCADLKDAEYSSKPSTRTFNNSLVNRKRRKSRDRFMSQNAFGGTCTFRDQSQASSALWTAYDSHRRFARLAASSWTDVTSSAEGLRVKPSSNIRRTALA